ncbi:MAG: sulfotransferase family protein [Thermoleophilaceae bacterium]|nr:sulfotransferase family protein [Thermoleophilaceae bacterium]
MKVVGVGFGRSGTMSLKQALEDLGQGPCLHMIDLIRNNELIPPWQEAAIEGNVDFDKMFEGFESTIDWPGCTYWKDLIDYYPDALVLLNYRDFDGWYKSVNNTIVAVRKASMAGELKPDANRPPPPPELWQVIGKLIYEVDFQGNVEDEAWMRDMYYARIEEIKATVPAERLIEFNLEDSPGWEPLTEKLGVEAPDKEFPHLHDTEEFRAEFGLPPLAKA